MIIVVAFEHSGSLSIFLLYFTYARDPRSSIPGGTVAYAGNEACGPQLHRRLENNQNSIFPTCAGV